MIEKLLIIVQNIGYRDVKDTYTSKILKYKDDLEELKKIESEFKLLMELLEYVGKIKYYHLREKYEEDILKYKNIINPLEYLKGIQRELYSEPSKLVIELLEYVRKLKYYDLREKYEEDILEYKNAIDSLEYLKDIRRELNKL